MAILLSRVKKSHIDTRAAVKNRVIVEIGGKGNVCSTVAIRRMKGNLVVQLY